MKASKKNLKSSSSIPLPKKLNQKMEGKKSEAHSQKKGAERRRSGRSEVLDTFNVFMMVPRCGSRKVYLKDVSEHGVSFFGEPEERFIVGDEIAGYFYINPTLRLPLQLSVAHVLEKANVDGQKKIGCSFKDRNSKAYKTFLSFMNLLGQLSGFLEEV